MTKKDFAKILFETGAFPSKAEAERKVELFLATIENTLASGEELNFIGWENLKLLKELKELEEIQKLEKKLKLKLRKQLNSNQEKL